MKIVFRFGLEDIKKSILTAALGIENRILWLTSEIQSYLTGRINSYLIVNQPSLHFLNFNN
ncbi:hypothetical protein BST93_05615 [Nonlabens tegetincola]|nr:hypothetical protein BST93_05615 [Nonlabens tegetincola]